MSKLVVRFALFVVFIFTIFLSGLFFTSHGQSLAEGYLPVATSLKEYAFSVSTSGKDDKQSDATTGSTKLNEGIIMPKLLNETAKAELGRHAWYLFHTVLGRFPERPRPSDREDLVSYIKYFTKLYPCGDCASHFLTILEKYPPQTSTRVAAANWGCAVHNEVNLSLKKPVYNCMHILEDYDCGCSS